MRNRLLIALLLAVPVAFASEWSEVSEKLTPGNRVEVQHKGKFERGVYALSNANEIVITTKASGQLSIPRAEVERVILRGVESPTSGYFGNANDQLFPKPEIVYERAGAPPPARVKKSRHWWSKR